MATATKEKTKNGKITQIVGVVVDVEFSTGNIPAIYNALKLEHDGSEITLEVAQHLSESSVRAIALSSSSFSAVRRPVTRSSSTAMSSRMLKIKIKNVYTNKNTNIKTSYLLYFKKQHHNKQNFVQRSTVVFRATLIQRAPLRARRDDQPAQQRVACVQVNCPTVTSRDKSNVIERTKQHHIF